MKRLILGILVAIGLVSVSFGAWIPEDDEANYQKLKVEMEEVEQSEYWKSDDHQVICSWGEDGKMIASNKWEISYRNDWCELKNVLAFFDEIRAMEVKTKNRLNSPFLIAIAKVREMPRFKNDDGIYIYVRGGNMDWKTKEETAVFNDYAFWERVFEKWKETKLRISAQSYM